LKEIFFALLMPFYQYSLYHLLSLKQVELPWSLRWRFAYQIALGINSLHQRRPVILHRDLKTSNILLDEKFNVAVSDFGLSEFYSNSIEGDRTLPFQVPEILSSKFSEKSDTYAYGMVLLELATHEMPSENIVNRSILALPKVILYILPLVSDFVE